MAQEEGKLIAQVEFEEVPASAMKTKTKRSSQFVNEWVYFLLGSSNAKSTNSYVLKDPYSFCKDVVVPKTNGNDLLWFFYNNRLCKLPISKTWNSNFGKLIRPEAFVDVDILKGLIKGYNLVIL